MVGAGFLCNDVAVLWWEIKETLCIIRTDLLPSFPPLQMKLDSPPTAQLDVAVSSSSNSSPQPVSEKLVFLCGQCNEGFPSLEACKQHMMQVTHRNGTLLHFHGNGQTFSLLSVSEKISSLKFVGWRYQVVLLSECLIPNQNGIHVLYTLLKTYLEICHIICVITQ